MTSIPPPGGGQSWGVGYGYSPPGAAPPDRPPERLPQVLMRVAAGLGVLLILVVANALMHSDGEALNPVAEAAERMQRTPGARMTIEAVYSSAALSQPIVATGSGAYNSRTGRSRVSMSVPSSVGKETMEGVGDERAIYLRSRSISAGLPGGKSWFEIRPWLVGSEQTAAAGGDAKSEVEMLRAVSDDVDSLGEEELRGVATERYRGTIDLAHYAGILAGEGKRSQAQIYDQLAKQIPAPVGYEAWIDRSGALRKARVVMTMPTDPGHPALTMDMRIELFDFGITPQIELPDPGEVFDATPLALAQLHMLTGRSAGSLIHPSGAPLAQSAFRQRASAICRGARARSNVLGERASAGMRAIRESGEIGSVEEAESLPMVLREATYTYYEPIIAMVNRVFRRLGRLSPPADKRAAFNGYLRRGALQLEVLTAETRALEAGEFTTAKRLGKRLDRIANATDPYARRAGLPACLGKEDAGGSDVAA